MREALARKVYGSHELVSSVQHTGRYSVDLSKFKTSDWLKVGGGVIMLIAGFLTWWQPSCPGGAGNAECEAAVDALGLDITAFDLTFSGLFPWILLVAIGVLTFLAAAGIFKLPASVPTPIIFLAASAYSLIFVAVSYTHLTLPTKRIV